jgi:hypothetical protein
MANPVTTPAPAGYWGVIQSAAAQKLTTAALWQQISDFEAAQGITRPTGLFLAVSAMRALAVTQRIASNLFGKVGDDQALTSAMIAQDINARPLGDQALAPLHVVRFEATVLTNEGESTQWLSVMYQGGLPATKGQLIGEITDAGVDLSTGYGSVFTGLTGNISITAR